MIGAWLMVLCAVAGIVLALEARQSYRWHHAGDGEREARREYARLRCEGVDTAETRLPEAEFIRYYVDARPGATRYAIASCVLLAGGLPGSWILWHGWPWS